MSLIFLTAFGGKLAAQTQLEPGFEASCLNFVFQDLNSQVYLEISGESFARKNGSAHLQVSITARQFGKAFSPVEKTYLETLFFGPNLELPSASTSYSLQLEAGLYVIGIEIRDLISGKVHYREIDYNCADTNQEFSWSDVLLLCNTALIPEEAIQTVTGDIMPPDATKIRFIAEAYGPKKTEFTANAVLFRRASNPGAIRTLRFTSLAQVNQALSLDENHVQFSYQFDVDSLPSGEYLLEIYLYKEGYLVATQNRKFALVWRELDELLENLEEAIPEMALITSQTVIDSLLALQGKVREKAFLAFWTERNSPQSQSPTDAMENYFTRILYANEHFQEDIPGWKTDRGLTYFHYGKPNRTSSLTFKGKEIEFWQFEQWGLKFVFVRKGNNFVKIDPGNLSHL